MSTGSIRMAQSGTTYQRNLCTGKLTPYSLWSKQNWTITKEETTPVRSALGQAQRHDEALSELIQWIERGKVPTPQELQGLPRLAWQLNNHFKTLQLLDGILCRSFQIGGNEVVLQQLVPPWMTHEILSVCHSSSTAGHLGADKTSEKVKQRFYCYWPGLQVDTKLFVSRCPECRKRSGPPNKYHHSWQNGEHVILFTTLEMNSWDLCPCKMETDISLSLEITLKNDMKQYHYQIKQLSHLRMI